jgi:hypothetical protein
VTTPNSFDPQRVPVPSELRRQLSAGGTVDVDDGWLAELVEKNIQHGAGYLVLTGLDGDDAVLRDVCIQLSSSIGTVLAQDSSGTRLREVADRGTQIGEGASARYADSRHGGSLHTDGAESPMPVPDCFALLCVRQAPVGGALRLVHVEEVVRGMSSRADLLEELRRPFHFDRRGDQGPGESPTTQKPVLFEDSDGLGVTYLREYIEVGHSQPDVPPLTEKQHDALDLLDRILNQSPNAIEGKLAPGEFALFNNKRLLHGRTTFQDDSDPGAKRLLFRTWIRRTR